MYLERVLDRLTKNLKEHNADVPNVYELIRLICKLVNRFDELSPKQKKKLVMVTIHDIVYNDDDLLPRDMIHTMEVMINNDLLASSIDFVADFTQVKRTWSIIRCICCCCCCSMSDVDAPLLHDGEDEDLDFVDVPTHPPPIPTSKVVSV